MALNLRKCIDYTHVSKCHTGGEHCMICPELQYIALGKNNGDAYTI